MQFIINIGSNEFLTGIATICTIIGFCLTIYLTWRTNKMNKILRYNSSIYKYNEEYNEYKGVFNGHRVSIEKDNTKTKSHLNDILSHLESFNAKFNSILSKDEKQIIRKLRKIINKDKQTENDYNIICRCLASLTGKMSEKEDIKNV